MDAEPIHVIGASGRSGQGLCRRLLELRRPFVPVVREAAKWGAIGLPVPPRLADLTDASALARVLRDATRIVSTAHARHAAAIIAAAPPAARIVLMGSTRRFTHWMDAHGAGVIAGETALLASGRDGVILHPTMIYGAQGEDNVKRLASLLRRLPLVPLPLGGRARVQPIHQDDVTQALILASDRAWKPPRAIVLAGPAPLYYADFVRAVARAAGQREPRVVAVPEWPLLALAPLTRVLPFVPRVRRAEIRRLTEHKAFDTAEMRRELGLNPRALPVGLAQTFPAVHIPPARQETRHADRQPDRRLP